MSLNRGNPYALTIGYRNCDDQAIDGYGLTFESIHHWLFQNHLSVKPRGYLNAHPQINPQTDPVADGNINEWLARRINDLQIQKLSVNHVLCGPILAALSVRPTDQPRMVPTIATVKKQLFQAIQIIYQIPDQKLRSLLNFVDQYADVISVCDEPNR